MQQDNTVENQQMVINVKPGQEITIMLTIRAIPECPRDEAAPLSLHDIADRVCRALGITFEKLSSPTRAQAIVCARFIYCYVAYKLYGYSDRRTATYIHRDRSSVKKASIQYLNMVETKFEPMLNAIRRVEVLFPIKIKP